MAVASLPNKICCREKVRDNIEVPIIDLSAERSEVSKLIIKACEDYGFFKVINHGVPEEVIGNVEKESVGFFSKPESEKQAVGPSHPFGYGCKTIGFRGDVGEIEYLILNTNPLSIAQMSKTISNDPNKFSSAVVAYIEAITSLASEILELIAKGLWVPDTKVFSRLIKNADSDSVLRLNHYFPIYTKPAGGDCQDTDTSQSSHCNCKVGIGEHSDPQILTLLRSNDVVGLQISTQAGAWISIAPDPTAFFVNVGDALQVMTNGRFPSVRHRVVTSSSKSRMSMGYFGAPPLNATIAAPPEMITPEKPCLYRPFTWAQYKKVAHSLKLGDSRLALFTNTSNSQFA